jgi:hypothetical protein
LPSQRFSGLYRKAVIEFDNYDIFEGQIRATFFEQREKATLI